MGWPIQFFWLQMRIHKIFCPIVLSHKSSSEMSASGYVTLLIRSVESSPSLIASYHLAFKRVLKNNNFFKNHFLISNLTLVVELSVWVVQNCVNFDMKTLGLPRLPFGWKIIRILKKNTSCHFDRSLNVEIGFEYWMILLLSFHWDRVLRFGSPLSYFKPLSLLS